MNNLGPLNVPKVPQSMECVCYEDKVFRQAGVNHVTVHIAKDDISSGGLYSFRNLKEVESTRS